MNVTFTVLLPIAVAFFVGYGLLLVSRFLRVEAAAERELARSFGDAFGKPMRKRADRLYRCSKVVLHVGLIFIAGSTVYAVAAIIVIILAAAGVL